MPSRCATQLGLAFFDSTIHLSIGVVRIPRWLRPQNDNRFFYHLTSLAKLPFVAEIGSGGNGLF
jgi:hypothetical protein